MVIERDETRKNLNAIKAEEKSIARGEKLRDLTSELVASDNLLADMSDNVIDVGSGYAGFEGRGVCHISFRISLDPKKREITVEDPRTYNTAMKVARAYEKIGEKEFTVIKDFSSKKYSERKSVNLKN